jgi:hypothetical protein
MPDTPLIRTRDALKTPRSAAVAGIIFAVLYGSSLILLSLFVLPYISDTTWMETNAAPVSLALNLIPFAGIAFLWFIGVLRDLLADQEDRLFSTVFLGSGLLFLAMTFIGAALVAGLLNAHTLGLGTLSESVYTYSRSVIYQVINIYAIRMAGVFMISLATIWIRTGVMHRVWAILTYLLALVLLVSISYSLWVTLIFPGWVMVVSVYILIRNLHRPPPEDNAEGKDTASG